MANVCILYLCFCLSITTNETSELGARSLLIDHTCIYRLDVTCIFMLTNYKKASVRTG